MHVWYMCTLTVAGSCGHIKRSEEDSRCPGCHSSPTSPRQDFPVSLELDRQSVGVLLLPLLEHCSYRYSGSPAGLFLGTGIWTQVPCLHSKNSYLLRHLHQSQDCVLMPELKWANWRQMWGHTPTISASKRLRRTSVSSWPAWATENQNFKAN